MKNMITAAQVAEQMGVSPVTVRRWVANGQMPKPHAILGRCKLWNQAWLTRWLSTQSHDLERAKKKAEHAAEMAKVAAEQAEFERANPLLAAQLRMCR